MDGDVLKLWILSPDSIQSHTSRDEILRLKSSCTERAVKFLEDKHNLEGRKAKQNKKKSPNLHLNLIYQFSIKV